MHFLCTKAVEQIAHYESRFILIADMEVKMDKLYWGAVVIFAIGWYIEQRMYVDGYTRRKRDPYKPIDYLGVFSIGEFVGYLIRSLVAPAFVWFPDIHWDARQPYSSHCSCVVGCDVHFCSHRD